MIPPIANAFGAKPAISWVLSRLSSLDPRLHQGDDAGAGVPDGLRAQVPPRPGVSQTMARPSDVVSQTPSYPERGWIEDRLLVALGEQMLPSPPASPSEHVAALRSAILQLQGDDRHAAAVGVLTAAVAGHGAVQQGRNALQEV